MVVDEVLGMWWDDRSLKIGGRGVGIYARDALSPGFRGSSHIATFVKTPSTVISFNMADIIVFPGRLQLL